MSLATTRARDLDALAHEINRQQQFADDHFRTSLQHALRVGQLLLEAKDQVGHGEWLTWLVANTSVSDRTARGYMQLARGRGNRRPVADLGLRDALAAIAEPRDEEESLPSTGDLGARLREAGIRPGRPHRSQDEQRVWGEVDSAVEAADRHARLARRQDLELSGRSEAAANAAAAAREAAQHLESLAAMLRPAG